MASGYSNLQEYNSGTDPTNSASYPTSAPPGLVVWWKLDEGSGTAVADASGNGYSGSLQGDPEPLWTNGVVSGGLNFDGYQNYVGSDQPICQTFTSVTMACWFKADNVSGENPTMLSTIHDDNPFYGEGYIGAFSIFNPDTRPDLGYLISFFMAGEAVTLATNAFDGYYHQVAGAWDGSQIELYYDGVLVGATNAPGDPVTADCYVRIAFQDTNGGCFLGGNLGEVRIYNRVLSSNEVAAIFNTDTIGDGIPDWWRQQYFGSGTTTDSTSCASCNPEGDGLSNLQKYQNGLDPFVSYAVTAPPIVLANSSGNMAWVTDAGAGVSYSWAIDNGTIDSGSGTTNVSWSAGDGGMATLRVQLTTSGGTINLGAAVVISPCTLPSTITVPNSAFSASTANTASVPTGFFTLNSGFTNGAPYGIEQSTSSDSNFYGLADIVIGELFFKMTPAGTLTMAYQFDTSHVTNGYGSYLPLQGTGNDTNHFYGVTYFGGKTNNLSLCLGLTPWIGYGSIFKLTQQGASMTLTTLYKFTSSPDGANPIGGLVFGAGGDSNNFYGVTEQGGSAACSIDWGCCLSGNGTVFKFSSTAGTNATLYRFLGGSDGEDPRAGIILGRNGYLYGVTSAGSGNYGTVFRINTNGNATSFLSLHQFTNSGGDGATPLGSLVEGSGTDSNNFYGTAYGGGTNGYGTVFKVNSNGTSFVTLHQFSGTADGAYPAAALVQSYDGNYYGTTTEGGPNGNGAVFRMTPAGTLTTLYSFTGGADGGRPDYGEQVSGKGTTLGSFDGYLYGATSAGGSLGHGTVYKVSLASYTWSITGGTITSGLGTPNITWTAGSGGAATICVTVSNSAVCNTNICSSFIPINSPIAAGAEQGVAVTPDGKLWAWGWNDGNLGDGLDSTIRENVFSVEGHLPYPSDVAPVTSCGGQAITNAVALAAGGDDFTLVADANGAVWTFGENTMGQLGIGSVGDTNIYSVPMRINGVSNVVSVAAGYRHALALRADMKVFAWGDDTYGQLGVGGSSGQTNTPIQSLIPTGTNIVAIAAGYSHSVALDATGRIWLWGSGTGGQLGDAGFTNLTRPTLLTNISNVIAIAAGDYHTIALASNHTVWTWGENDSGQLGRSGLSGLPGQVSNLTGVVAIAGGGADLASPPSGGAFTLAVTSNGLVYAWGDNSVGQLGTNSSAVAFTNRPLLVAGISNVVSVSTPVSGDGGNDYGDVGGAHVVAMTVDQGTNHYWGWGDNNAGEVGNGISGFSGGMFVQYTNQYAPAQVQFCTRCQRTVQLGTSGSFTAECNGTLYLYFNDEVGLFSDNSGSFTVTVNAVTTNVPASDPTGYGIGIAVGMVTNGGVYSFTASGFCFHNGSLPKTDADGNLTNGLPSDCSSINITNAVCPIAKCFSLVGEIQ